MRAIRQKDTKPELVIRKGLHAAGFRYQLHRKDLPGRPDLVLPKYRAAIFIHGCFWHGHGCHLFKIPQTRTEFWINKIQANRVRDEKDLKNLLSSGWRVLVVWECALKGRHRLEPASILAEISGWLQSTDPISALDSTGITWISEALPTILPKPQ